MKVTGKRAVQAVRHALAEAGLGRTSKMNGGAVTGWIARNHGGSTGFSVKPTANEGEVVWNVVISGKPHLSYRSWTDSDGMRFSEPTNPGSLSPRIRAAFEDLGLDVRSVTCGGYQTHWDDDVNYSVVTNYPEWLERHNPDNPPPKAEGPLLMAMKFRDTFDHKGPLSPTSDPLAGYLANGRVYLTGESVRHLADLHATLLEKNRAACERARQINANVEEHNKGVRERNEIARKENPSGFVPERERFPTWEPEWDLGRMSLSENGEFFMAPRGRGEHRCAPVEITNHWGDTVKVWEMPGYWMERLDSFAPVVPVLIDGEMRDKVPFPVVDAQFGGDVPWIQNEPVVTRRM